MNTLKGKFLSLVILAIVALFPNTVSARDVFIPNFWDKNERFSKPRINNIPRLRFLTTTDFPPFNFVDGKKRLSGFHVDLAREICSQLKLLNRCEIQALPWAELNDALSKGTGEALIAGIAVTTETRKKFSFTRSYFRIPARFIVKRDSGLTGSAFDALFKKNVGVIKGSAHAAYYSKIFGSRTPTEFANRESAFAAIKSGEVDSIFADAVSLSYWLSSKQAEDCCVFLDGAYDSRKYFGNGLRIAVAKNREELANALNFALAEINRKGVFEELYLRYFPLSLY